MGSVRLHEWGWAGPLQSTAGSTEVIHGFSYFEFASGAASLVLIVNSRRNGVDEFSVII